MGISWSSPSWNTCRDTGTHWNGDRCFLFYTEKWMWKLVFLSAISLGKSHFIFLINKLFFVFHDPETAKTIRIASTNASWMQSSESGSKGEWERKRRGNRDFLKSSSSISWANALSVVSAFVFCWVFSQCHCFFWLMRTSVWKDWRQGPNPTLPGSWEGSCQHQWKSMQILQKILGLHWSGQKSLSSRHNQLCSGHKPSQFPDEVLWICGG